jgi:LPS-assembly protein
MVRVRTTDRSLRRRGGLCATLLFGGAVLLASGWPAGQALAQFQASPYDQSQQVTQQSQGPSSSPSGPSMSPILTFRQGPARGLKSGSVAATAGGKNAQMLVQANEIQYDYNNERVAAVGNVQIYYNGSTIEADRIIYDQKTKRLHAEGNARLTEPNGRVTYGNIMDLSDDYRDGFVDSLRVDSPDNTRIAAARADRSQGNYTVFQSGVYTACEPCKDDPRKPPTWQIKGARIIHDQTERMIYYENAKLEFFGLPVAYFPYFSAPDPTVKRKTGFLIPSVSYSGKYGFGTEIPYFWALAPDYDFTFSPLLTTNQGPLLQGDFRQRLESGAYNIRAAGIYQLDKDYFLRNGGPSTPGYRDFRGSVDTAGQFAITDRWLWGWTGSIFTDRTFVQDYHLRGYQRTIDVAGTGQTEAVSQLYLVGKGERSYFDARTMYFYGFSEADQQNQIPIIHPVVDYNNTLAYPVFGGELSYRVNLTSLSRQEASFDPISQAAFNGNLCNTMTADPAVKIPTNCLLRGIPGVYSRFSAEANWRKRYVDSFGQVFTPFVSMRGDLAAANIENDPSVGNFINTGDTSVARAMPTAGVEYRYPFLSAHSWGTQTLEPIAQVIVRPDETNIGRLPNEDAQSLVFDDSNLFRVDKFSGWDRVEGGGRANVGVQYTAQFNRGGFFNVLFGQSYHLFGLNSFAVGDITHTGLDSGLDKSTSDYVARMSYQPFSTFQLTTRYRFGEEDLTLQRFEVEGRGQYDRWNYSLLYGNYAAQPQLGFLDRREGILGTAGVKINPNWVAFGGARYNLHAGKFDQTQLGVGYVDDCLILAMNYVTNYTYSGNPVADHRVMFQISLRTLGGTVLSQSVASPSIGP